MNHVVRAGESPMSIADAYTGDPYRYTELLQANGHKPMAVSQGRWTFQSLHVGEVLQLPAGWPRRTYGALDPAFIGVGVSAPEAQAQQSLYDAITVLSLANSFYSMLVDSSTGAPNSLVSESGSGTSQDDGTAAAYNAQMMQAMNLYVQASQKAADTIKQVASYNPNASVYGIDPTLIPNFMKQIESGIRGDPNQTYYMPANWFNCSSSQSQSIFGYSAVNWRCYPDAGWLEYTYGVASFAQEDVKLAQDAFDMPLPNKPNPPSHKCPKAPNGARSFWNGHQCVILLPIGPFPKCPKGQIWHKGKCITPPTIPAPTHMRKEQVYGYARR